MNMNRYFTEERKISIVKQLQQNNGISLAEMAEKLNVSTRTIRNDLKLINEELEDAAFIELEQGNCYLYITNRQKLEQKRLFGKILKTALILLKKAPVIL